MPPRHTSLELARKIGARVRDVRELTGLTQEAAAWAADLSKGYLSRIEAGTHLPSLDALDRLAKCMNCKLTDLVNVDDNGSPPTA